MINREYLTRHIEISLDEDWGIYGDITSDTLLKNNIITKFRIINKQPIYFCGFDIANYLLQRISAKYKCYFHDSEYVPSGQIIIEGQGEAKLILAVERVLLNYLQHLSAISTKTHMYVTKVAGTKAKICDTRKTIPGIRALQKYAVQSGGGFNHRGTIDGCVFIKDNHIAIMGGIENIMDLIKEKKSHYTKVIIECDTVAQVHDVMKYEIADIILLDNMSLQDIQNSLQIIDNRVITEVSGGVNLSNVKQIAELGVDNISIGRLTHSVEAVDLSLEILNN